MKRHIGLHSTDYETDRHGRVTYSPMMHHPDLCPYYGPEEVGECAIHCSQRPCYERPCNSGKRTHILQEDNHGR